MPTMMVTGAAGGLGKCMAEHAARAGYKVGVLDLVLEQAQAVAKSIGGVALEADVSDPVSVARAFETFGETPDVLINNAGVFNKRRRYTPDGNEMTLGIVHLASLLLTLLLTENLQNGAPSRVLFVNSEAHRFGGFNLKDLNWRKRPYIGMLAYGAAKIAQIQTALELSDRLEDSGVMVNLMHPGAVKTNIGMNNGLFYRLYNHYILRLFLKDPVQSAKAIYFLAADPSLKMVTGKYFNQTIEEKPAWYSVRADRRKAVWRESEALIKPYLEES